MIPSPPGPASVALIVAQPSTQNNQSKIVQSLVRYYLLAPRIESTTKTTHTTSTMFILVSPIIYPAAASINIDPRHL